MPTPIHPPRRLDALGDDTEARLAAGTRHATTIDRATVPRLPPVSSSRARRLPDVDITTSHASFSVDGSRLGTGSAASDRRVRRETGGGEVGGSIPGGPPRVAPGTPPSPRVTLDALRVDVFDSRARREAKKKRDARGAAYAWGDGFAGELAGFRTEDLTHVGGGTTFTACTTSRGIALELRRRDGRADAAAAAAAEPKRFRDEKARDDAASAETSTSLSDDDHAAGGEIASFVKRARGRRAPRVIAASRCEITDVAVAVCADGSLATISAAAGTRAVSFASDDDFSDDASDDAREAFFDASDDGDAAGANEKSPTRLKPLPAPRRVPGTRELRFKRVACGGGHVLALAGAGDVYAFGANDSGQLGLGDRAPRDSPAYVAGEFLVGAEGVLRVAAGDTHSAAVTARGRVFTWGGNERGQLGHGRALLGEDALVPKPVAAMDAAGHPALSVACASKAVVALFGSGDVVAWGSGACGALGGGVSDDAPEPKRIDPARFGNERIVAVSAGHEHFAALAESRRSAFVWGSNAKGQLGSLVPRRDADEDGEKTVRAVARLAGLPRDRDLAFVAAAGDRTFAVLGPASTATRDGGAREPREDVNGPVLLPPLLELAETVAARGERRAPRAAGADGGVSDETETETETETDLDLDLARVVAAESAEANRVTQLLGAVDDVFSSPGFLVDGFSVPVDGKGSAAADATRIDFDAVVSTYDAVVDARAPRPALLAALADACARACKRLEEALDEAQRSGDDASPRVARAFLVLWLSPLHGDPAFRDALLPRLAAIGARLPADALEGEAVPSLARAFDSERRRAEAFATRLAKPVLACVARRLGTRRASSGTSPSRATDDFADDPALLGLARMLRCLAAADAFAARTSRGSTDAPAASRLPASAFQSPELSDALNLRREYTRWLEGERSFCEFPCVFTTEAKARVLRGEANLQKRVAIAASRREPFFSSERVRGALDTPEELLPFGHPDAPFLELVIDRERVLTDTVAALRAASREKKKRPLRVRFTARGVEEEGVDEGGVTKEFFQLVVREMFDAESRESARLFARDDESGFYWFSRARRATAADERRALELYALFGAMLGLALYNGVTLDVHLAPAAYRRLVEDDSEEDECSEEDEYSDAERFASRRHLSDLAELSPSLGGSLEAVRDFRPDSGDDAEAAFQEAFGPRDFVAEQTCVDAEGRETTRTRELAPGGAGVPVTYANREAFVARYAEFLMRDSVSRPLRHFKRGFRDACGGPAFGLLSGSDLELLVRGEPGELDFRVWRAAAEYEGGFGDAHPAVETFWRVAESLAPKRKRRLLFFVTGCGRAPAGGLANVPLCVQRAGGDSDFLPTAHTCFNTLLLPEYATEEKMRERMVTALENAEGFGLQ